MNPMKIQAPISSVKFPDSHELEHAEKSIQAKKKNKLLHLLPSTTKKVARHVVGFYFRFWRQFIPLFFSFSGCTRSQFLQTNTTLKINCTSVKIKAKTKTIKRKKMFLIFSKPENIIQKQKQARNLRINVIHIYKNFMKKTLDCY